MHWRCIRRILLDAAARQLYYCSRNYSRHKASGEASDPGLTDVRVEGNDNGVLPFQRYVWG